MNILLDFIPFQHAGGLGGAASFTKAVTDRVAQRRTADTRLFAAYDSRMAAGQQYDHQLLAKELDIKLLDLAKWTPAQMVSANGIDVFFISIAQFYANYDLRGIGCKTVMFIHDIFDLESADNRIDLALYDPHLESRWQWMKRYINVFSHRWDRKQKACYQNIIPLYAAANTVAYTVSHYTAMALKYYFPEIRKDIRVCYSPPRHIEATTQPADKALAQLIDSGKPYLMLIAANRRYKNAGLLAKAYLRLLDEHPDLHLLTLKYGCQLHRQHTDIAFLSDADMQHAYRHAHALVFASFFEGFGYPPIEALSQGTPVVAANVTSIPEILGDAGIYFSPLYPADLYRALTSVLADRDLHRQQMQQRYEEVSRRQQTDLDKLVDELLKK